MTRAPIRAALAGAALSITAAAAAPAEPLNDWLGSWSDPDSNGVVGVELTIEDGFLKISAQGACSPNPCEWGQVDAYAHAPSPAVNPADDTEAILAIWEKGFSVTTMILNRTDDGKIAAQSLTYFTDGSGRTDYASTSMLSKPRLAAVLHPAIVMALSVPRDDEDCIDFDPTTVAAREVGGRWKVTSGSMYMLDAGPNEDEMRRAEAVIKRYGFAHQCFVGRPDAALEYWLTPTGAPSGPLPIEDCVGINPNNLSTRQNGARWTVLSNGSHAAFSADSEAEANRVIEIVERYGFTQSCFVGRPGPSMRYLRKD